MSKNGLALSSLVMAIPAGYLAYLCVGAVFGANESMPAAVTVIVWSLIVLSGLLALSPFIFLVAGPSGAVAASAPAHSKPAAAPVQSGKKASAKESSDDEFSQSGEVLSDEDGQLFDTSDDEAGVEEYEDQFNFDDDDDLSGAFEDEEEEPAPKKKKR